MVNYNDTLYGITLNGYLVVSKDNGLNWKLKKIEIETGEKLLKMLVIENGIYVRGIQTMYKLDRKGNIIKSLKSFVFEPTYNTFRK